MDSYTILCTELRGSAQSLNGNIETLQDKADKLQKAINKVTRGDYNYSDLSSAYTAQSALTGSITRLGEICGAMNTAALQFSEASTELSGRANLTAYYMQHTDTLSYEGLMGTFTAAIASAGSAAAGYELVKSTLEENGYSVSNLGSVSNAVQDAIQREAEEQARRAEEAKWAKISLTGLVIVGGIVASVVTGGAAAPIVIGAISGAVMAGGNTVIDQYAEHGWNTENWDYAEIGKDAFVGGVTGAATAWIGGTLTKGVTILASSTQWGSTLLNSSNAYVRVGTGAFIGSASEIVSGVGSRGTGAFISTMIETEGDLGKSLSDAADYAFDGKEIAQDAALGGLQGGASSIKSPPAADADTTPDKTYTKEELDKLRAKAVEDAWKNEAELVRQGKGTRDWTVSQQAELLKYGKVSGFEGQHMKNVADYPEFAGDSSNIQFLTYEEHLYGGHGGNFQNASNGRLDISTGEIVPFLEGERPSIPVINLTNTYDPEQYDFLKNLGRPFGYGRHEDIKASRANIFGKK